MYLSLFSLSVLFQNIPICPGKKILKMYNFPSYKIKCATEKIILVPKQKSQLTRISPNENFISENSFGKYHFL